MISRKSTKALAHVYAQHFKTSSRTATYGGETNYKLDQNKLMGFLYEEDYEPWFLSLMKYIRTNLHLRNSIMEIHTLETIKPSTPNWSTERQNILAQTLLNKLAEDILSHYASLPPLVQANTGEVFTDALYTYAARAARPAQEEIKTLQAQLEVDGYVYRDGHLYFTESSVIDEKVEQEYLVDLFTSLKLGNGTVIKHHVELSEEHYVKSKYDDSISNARKVLDAVLGQVASSVYAKVNKKPIPPEMLRNATDVRGFLEKQNLLTKVEREALDKNYGALSATGGHPYIAEKDQARLMRHLALTFSQFVLLRYQGFLQKNP